MIDEDEDELDEDEDELDEDEDELDEDEDGVDGAPPVNDRAGLHVMREQCSTCIFRPGDPMSLRPGRVRDMTSETDARDTNVVCHQTLDRPIGALCRGSVDRRAGQMVRIAARLGLLIEDGVGDKVPT